MNIAEQIRRLKHQEQSRARADAIEIRDDEDLPAGMLVPIGAWALKDPGLIDDFTAWRRAFRRFFLTRFTETPEHTLAYLKNVAIAEEDRILFALTTLEGRVIGHLGLCNISAECGELDNFIRGVSGGPPNLMFLAERQLLRWAFFDLGLERILAQVLSFNFLAHGLHAPLGFEVLEQRCLRQSTQGPLVSHSTCEPEDSNVSYKLDLLALDRSVFEALAASEPRRPAD
ncbi:GNAT family N-acetyltransferase [Pseudohoeflea coraliihabitans]|uniref:GNAT family N-acetyltransferase n=1 Tax=Pseudohoeflea coraliihabitans TaxID=2860393 RepID=A0ABS6WKK6_9HYPH|nr:GNAT family N-acetyltransferase [Pseudohoeflea sp. DP4N28-3]MBW3096486.1 GNAT family N-acetyltransferase [Pseudohoeflea sp. DP4N28-3]